MRVLVVEDDQSTREVLTQVLHQMGHTTYAAHNEAEATRVLPLLKPQVVLLDLLLDGTIATTFIKTARELMRAQSPRVIVISALYGAKNIADAEGTEFLAKPFDLDMLHDMLLKGSMSPLKMKKPEL